jgi:hypothetical protein
MNNFLWRNKFFLNGGRPRSYWKHSTKIAAPAVPLDGRVGQRCPRNNEERNITLD